MEEWQSLETGVIVDTVDCAGRVEDTVTLGDDSATILTGMFATGSGADDTNGARVEIEAVTLVVGTAQVTAITVLPDSVLGATFAADAVTAVPLVGAGCITRT